MDNYDRPGRPGRQAEPDDTDRPGRLIRSTLDVVLDLLPMVVRNPPFSHELMSVLIEEMGIGTSGP